jgi:DNA-binding NtrC family response regulator
VEDVLPLAQQFVRQCNLKYKASVTGISPAASDMLKQYDWPGNVRELRNAIKRAVLLAETGLIEPHHIRFVAVRARGEAVEAPLGLPAPPANVTLKDSERILIARAIEKTGGNKTKAATLLGIRRDVPRYRMRKLGIPDPD